MIFFGGSSSGKSYFICQKIVLENASEKGVNWLVCRNVATTIGKSVFNEITKAIYKMELAHLYKINRTNMTITCLANNKQILFVGLDDTEKIKSITPINGVIEKIFVEEATEVPRDAIKQLEKRMRGKTDVNKQIILAFNPILKSHYIYKDYFTNWDDTKNVYEDKDLFILRTTYRDNIFLTEQDRYLLENEQDPYWKAVYCDGKWGILGNVIFKNWETRDLSKIENQFDRIYCGVDFGWNDPNAFLKISVNQDKKEIYILDEIYRRGITLQEFGLEIKKKTTNLQYIYCDSAEPRSIHELNQMGIRALGVKKGNDSIIYGIRYLQQFKIIVNTKCQNFINEISQYHYKETKDGNVLEIPVDKNNHLMDCLRYCVSDLIMNAEVKATNKLY